MLALTGPIVTGPAVGDVGGEVERDLGEDAEVVVALVGGHRLSTLTEPGTPRIDNRHIGVEALALPLLEYEALSGKPEQGGPFAIGVMVENGAHHGVRPALLERCSEAGPLVGEIGPFVADGFHDGRLPAARLRAPGRLSG